MAVVVLTALPAGAGAAPPDSSAAQRPSAAAVRALTLESIEITGNTRTPEAIILRYLTASPGDEITAQKLEQDRLRLLATDYFTAVEFSTRPGSTRGAVVLEIQVAERGLASFETGFGYDDLYGWFLTLLGVRFDNAFGIESRFRMGLRLGFRIAGVDAEWDKPIPPQGGFGYALAAHVYNERHLFYGSGPEGAEPWAGGQWRRFTQDVTRVGAEAALRYRFGSATRFSFGIQGEINEPDSSFTDFEADQDYGYNELPAELTKDLDRSSITGFFFRAIRDTRDQGVYPLEGSFARLTLEINNSFLGGDYIFTKATADVRKHVALGGGKTVLSSRLSGGVISDGAPYYERFYLGGNYSIRGFPEWSLSTAGGDDAYWLLNAEIRTPLVDSNKSQPRLTGLLFFDAGQGRRRGEDARSVESALGYGLRLRLPWLGTLGVDFGVPLSEGRTGDEFRVHGLLGFSF